MLEKDGFVLFFGKEDVFSNFYYAPFKHKGILFKWSEQAVMYEKAMFFGATDIAREILRANSPQRCKQLGRSPRIPFVEKEWYENRVRIYTEVLRSKFTVPRLRAALLNTKYDTFVEASPFDDIWGIKLDAHHPYATQPDKWRGLNLLGQILTNLKADIKAETL